MPEEVIHQEIENTDAPDVVDTGVVSEVKLDNFDAFQSARIEGNQSAQPKVKAEEIQKDESPDAEEKPADKEILKGINPVEQDQEDVEGQPEVKPEKKVITPRDYSIFDPADIPAFKKMGNEAFDKVKKIYQENKELKSRPPENKSGLPDNYYSHPEAFTLDPNYRTAEKFATQAEQIQAHWKRQEYNITKNGKVSKLAWDDKNKQIIVQPEVEATQDDVEMVEKMLTDAREQTIEAKGKLRDITSNFKSKYEADINFLKEAEKKFFPDYDDSDKDPTKEFRKKVVETLPPSMRNSPLTSLFTKVGARNAVLLKEVEDLKKEIATLKGLKKDEQAAPPSKKNFVAGGKNGGGPIDYEFFTKARMEGRQ